MQIALILDSVVINIAAWDGISTWNPGIQYTQVDVTTTRCTGGEPVDIGCTYDGTNFTALALTPEVFPDVTARQIRQALVLSGVNLSTIDSTIAGLPDPAKTSAQIEWEYSNMFQRYRPLTLEVAAMLSWTSDQLDALWRLAATL
jgi:hypothetical protein